MGDIKGLEVGQVLVALTSAKGITSDKGYIVLRVKEDNTSVYKDDTGIERIFRTPEHFPYVKWKTVFDKTCLKEGMRVETKEGNIYMIAQTSSGELGAVRNEDHFELETHRIDLSYPQMDGLSIIKVFDNPDHLYGGMFGFLTSKGKLLWEKTEDVTQEMTLEEVCKELGKDIKIVKGDK